MRDPFIGHVIKSYRWYKGGQFDARWGYRAPHALRLGVELYDAVADRVMAFDFEAERKRREAEHAARTEGDGRPALRKRRRR